MDRKHNRIIYCLYFGAFLILWVLLFWKCRYGFPLDENFYILFCYRFMKGDIPVLHEWNPTQFFVIWLYPFVWLYFKIIGSSEHIILVFRYLFTFIWGISALLLFYRLRKISFVGAAFSSLIFLVFVPYGEMALYYNTIGLIAYSLALVIILTAERKKCLQYAFSGFLFAVAVTCCPFLFSLYVILLCSVPIALIKKKKGILRLFCCITVGAIPAIIAVYRFYVIPSSLGEVVNGLKYLMADRQHQFSYLEKIVGFFKGIYDSANTVLFVVLIMIAALLLSALKKSKESKILGLIIVCISIGILYIEYCEKLRLPDFNFANCFAFPPVFIGLYCGILIDNSVAKKIFYNMFIPGLIYMFCINISSNVGFEATVIPAVICNMASCFLFVLFLEEISGSRNMELCKKLSMIIGYCVFVLSFGMGLYCMSTYAYCNGRIKWLNAEIQKGTYNGIYSYESVRQMYYRKVEDLETIKNSDSKNVLLLADYWLYLDLEKKPSCSSCFYLAVDDVLLDQLEEYYQLYPQFIPDVIYVGHNHTDLLERVKSYGYSGEQTELGAYILYRQKS